MADILTQILDFASLDVQMREMEGFGSGKANSHWAMLATVFVTAYGEWAFRAFDALGNLKNRSSSYPSWATT